MEEIELVKVWLREPRLTFMFRREMSGQNKNRTKNRNRKRKIKQNQRRKLWARQMRWRLQQKGPDTHADTD